MPVSHSNFVSVKKILADNKAIKRTHYLREDIPGSETDSEDTIDSDFTNSDKE